MRACNKFAHLRCMQYITYIGGLIMQLETKTSEDVINDFKSQAQADIDFIALLTESLQKAQTQAQKNLDSKLYDALDWPVDFDGYVDYLGWFAKWPPHQSTAEAWKPENVPPDKQASQEVYDRLCHFYWLIDQKVGPDSATIVQNIPWFSDWLVDYANLWGSFLNTTESFNQDILESFINDSPKFKVEDSMIDGRPNLPSGWLTFNQFFARELNPGLRPIDSPMDNSVATSPADCTYKATYAIAEDSSIPEITLKQTHKFANIKDLLEGSQYRDAFGGGTFVHYFLGPYSYHRFHTPVAGIVRECYPVKGAVFLAVNLKNSQFDAPDSSAGGYEFTQARGVITIDTTDSPYGNVGIVAVIPVGMCQVSSVNMIATSGSTALKGDEFGYFLFGGSDIIVLFQAGTDAVINKDSQSYRLYGTPIATLSRLDD